jgi:hypothetical protein
MRKFPRRQILFFSFILTIVLTLFIPASAKSPDWVSRSDDLSKQLAIASQAKKCRPIGQDSPRLLRLDPTYNQCRRQSIQQVIQTIQTALATETEAALRVDLTILINAGERFIRSADLAQQYELPYIDLSQTILESLESTFKQSPDPEKATLNQLQKYTGINAEPGLAILVERQIREKLKRAEIQFPSKSTLEKDLKANASQISKIQQFLTQKNIPNSDTLFPQLKSQLFAYETFIRREVLPQVQQNPPLPAAVYAFKLISNGIDIPIYPLIQQAHTEFTQVQQKMAKLAPMIARQKGLKSTNYRDVIRALQAEQLSAKDSLRTYQQRATEIDAIIQQQHLVTLPDRPLKIRLSTPAELDRFPVPLYDGSSFVLPVFSDPEKAKIYNDFTNAAIAWTLTAHEGRPGHDLQFATLHDQTMPKARSDFGANAANIEGWATYAELIMQPYMPIEGQFMSMQFQLLRAARAFLEPELVTGKITIAAAMQVLTQDAGYSSFFAEQEIKRYTERMIGQAPAYFYGAQQFLALRSQVEKSLGKQFDPQKYHDFILAQGHLPPDLMRQVVLDSARRHLSSERGRNRQTVAK